MLARPRLTAPAMFRMGLACAPLLFAVQPTCSCSFGQVQATIDRLQSDPDDIKRSLGAILAGALGGAAVGAAAGSAVLGVGTGAGAAVGTVMGGMCGCGVSNATSGQ